MARALSPVGRRLVPRRVIPRETQRRVSVLSKDNPYLPQLLASNGLHQFLSPTPVPHPNPAKQDTHYLFSLSVDRHEAVPECRLRIRTASPKANKNYFKTVFLDRYPLYRPASHPPRKKWRPQHQHVKDVADVLWKAFCVNDFLELKVKGLLHPDGSWSFERCQAIVDESARHKQDELVKHVTRYEYPEEIEAEKSLLGYR